GAGRVGRMTAARAVLPAHSLAHVARGVGGQDDGAVWMRVAGSVFVRAAACPSRAGRAVSLPGPPARGGLPQADEIGFAPTCPTWTLLHCLVTSVIDLSRSIRRVTYRIASPL